MNPWSHTFIANGAILASGLASSVLAARFLGPEDRGLLAALIFWPHFMAGVGSLGLNEAIAIRTAKSGSASTPTSTILALSLALTVVLGCIGVWLLPSLLGSQRQDHLLFAQIYYLAFLPLTFVAMNFLAVSQGKLRFSEFNRQRVLQAAAYPVLLLAFWLTGHLTVETAALAVVAGTGIVAAVRLRLAKPWRESRPTVHEAAALLAQGARLHTSNLVIALSTQIDKMALIYLSTNVKLGLYAVATVAAGTAHSLIVQTYINVTLPTAAKSGINKESLREASLILRRLFLTLVSSSIVLILAMPIVIPIVFGDDYSGATEYAQILTVAFACTGMKRALLYLLRSWSMNRPGFLAEGCSALVLAIGVVPVLQRWDAIGLSLLVLTAQASGFLVLLYLALARTGLTVGQLTVPARDG